MSIQAKILTAAVMQGLLGCASEERLVFVTSTSIDVGYDATSGSANIGYNRDEAVIGPHYTKSGRVPPVYARLASTGGFFNVKVSQIYGVGKAAVAATRSPGSDCLQSDEDGGPFEGERRVLVFGTTTNFGLQVRFVQSAVPESVSFGFKRKEFSWIPLNGLEPSGTHLPDSYPSLLARVELGYDVVQAPQDSTFEIGQFIATGKAADNLACRGETKELFQQGAANPTAVLPTTIDSLINSRRLREKGGP